MLLDDLLERYFAQYHPHRCYPGLMFQQGKRTMIQINVPVHDLSTLVQEKPSTGNDPNSGKHRPEVKGHAEQIQHYILERITHNKPWILGTITANVAPEMVTVVEMGQGICLLVVPHNVKLDITDGQHRTLALKALSQSNQLSSYDALPITVVLEGDFKQCQVDFRDLALSKPVEPTFLASFSDSVRDRLTRIVIESVSMFKNKTDRFKKSPPRNSKLIYTTKYIATCVSCAFTETSNNELDEYEGEIEERAESLVNCLNQFFCECSHTHDIHKTNIEKLTLDQIIEFRDHCILGVSVGIEILGRLLYCTYNHQTNSFNSKSINQLTKLDWSRRSSLWHNNVVRVIPKQNKTKIAWGSSAVADAVISVKSQLGWM